MTLDFLVNPNVVVKPLRPVWYTIAQVSLPLGTREIDAVQLASALAIIFRVQIMLYDVFNRSSKRGSQAMGSRDVGAETGTLQFTYSYPLYEVDEPDGTKNTIALNSIAIGLILFLETLLDEGPATTTSRGRAERSIQEDQLEIFRQIEDNISSLGVDGRACVLRFICEMQTNKFSRASLFGELFTLLFTPKPGGDYTVLKEYIAAEEEGRQEGKDSARCAQKYRMCPLSVFAALRRLRGDVVAEMPTNTTISSPTGVSYLKDSVPWAWDTSAGEGY